MAADLGSRVLIADGDPAWRQRLFSRLLELDIFSDCVGNGQDALRHLGDLHYSVVVLDLALPGVDAMQVLAHIAQLVTRPVVLVTGGGDAARALEVDIVQMVLRKPVDLEQIADLVRNCVRSSARRRAAIVRPDEQRGQDRIRS
jgi:DNA-binding NtrC family response regulator